MVEATPSTWRDVCERCGESFTVGEPRWVEDRRRTVHTECAQWQLWEQPPYSWKLRELRTQYRDAEGERRVNIVAAGQAIRHAQAEWPNHAVEHVRRVLDAVHRLD